MSRGHVSSRPHLLSLWLAKRWGRGTGDTPLSIGGGCSCARVPRPRLLIAHRRTDQEAPSWPQPNYWHANVIVAGLRASPVWLTSTAPLPLLSQCSCAARPALTRSGPKPGRTVIMSRDEEITSALHPARASARTANSPVRIDRSSPNREAMSIRRECAMLTVRTNACHVSILRAATPSLRQRSASGHPAKAQSRVGTPSSPSRTSPPNPAEPCSRAS